MHFSRVSLMKCKSLTKWTFLPRSFHEIHNFLGIFWKKSAFFPVIFFDKIGILSAIFRRNWHFPAVFRRNRVFLLSLDKINVLSAIFQQNRHFIAIFWQNRHFFSTTFWRNCRFFKDILTKFAHSCNLCTKLASYLRSFKKNRRLIHNL